VLGDKTPARIVGEKPLEDFNRFAGPSFRAGTRESKTDAGEASSLEFSQPLLEEQFLDRYFSAESLDDRAFGFYPFLEHRMKTRIS
jgi:hypothetical protein